MGSFTFKSVGKTREQEETDKLTVTATPIGIKTPLRPGKQEGIFAMNFDLKDQVHDNLRNLIMSDWGGRFMLYDFGANLGPLLTEFVSIDDFDAKAIDRISGAVKRWMPYVSLENYVSATDHIENKNTAIIKLTITYNIPSLSVFNKALEVSLYVI